VKTRNATAARARPTSPKPPMRQRHDEAPGRGPPLKVKGEIRARFRAGPKVSNVFDVFESGGFRLKFPRGGRAREAVLLNAGGGLAGGDRLLLDLAVEDGADVVFTSQAAERVYRAEGEGCRIETRLDVSENGRLYWLPQETLLFDGASLERRLDVRLASGAELALLESVVFGRLASGESAIRAALVERWRVRRAGRLIFADETRITDGARTLDRVAVGAGARALATMLICAPEPEALVARLRGAFAPSAPEREGFEAGVSLVEGLVVARALSPDPGRLRLKLIDAIVAATGHKPPRVWG